MKQPRKSPETSAEIAEHIAGTKAHILDEGARHAVRDGLELNELLDKQRERRESEARARASKG
jgi:hypothetical protein